MRGKNLYAQAKNCSTFKYSSFLLKESSITRQDKQIRCKKWEDIIKYLLA